MNICSPLLCLILCLSYQCTIFSMQLVPQGFTTIKPLTLLDLIKKKPQKGLSPSQLQMWNMLAWTYCHENFEPSFDFFPQKNQKEFSLPDNLTQFINTHLPYSSAYRAKIQGFNSISKLDLWNLIKTSIDNEAPLLFYFQKNNQMHVATILGYKILAESQSDLELLISSSENGQELQQISFAKAHNLMDLSQTLALIHGIGPHLHRVCSVRYRALLKQLSMQLHNFTLITLVKNESEHKSRSRNWCQLL